MNNTNPNELLCSGRVSSLRGTHPVTAKRQEHDLRKSCSTPINVNKYK